METEVIHQQIEAARKTLIAPPPRPVFSLDIDGVKISVEIERDCARLETLIGEGTYGIPRLHQSVYSTKPQDVTDAAQVLADIVNAYRATEAAQ